TGETIAGPVTTHAGAYREPGPENPKAKRSILKNAGRVLRDRSRQKAPCGLGRKAREKARDGSELAQAGPSKRESVPGCGARREGGQDLQSTGLASPARGPSLVCHAEGNRKRDRRVHERAAASHRSAGKARAPARTPDPPPAPPIPYQSTAQHQG